MNNEIIVASYGTKFESGYAKKFENILNQKKKWKKYFFVFLFEIANSISYFIFWVQQSTFCFLRSTVAWLSKTISETIDFFLKFNYVAEGKFRWNYVAELREILNKRMKTQLFYYTLYIS